MEKKVSARNVIVLLGVTGFVLAALIMPRLPLAIKPLVKKQHKKWGHFNKARLRTELKRLKATGIIEETVINGESVYRLTEKGKEKIL